MAWLTASRHKHPVCQSSAGDTENRQNYGIFGEHRKHSYLTFCFAGNGLPPTTNKYCDFNATLMCNVMEEICNPQCPKLKIHNNINGDCIIFRYFAYNFPQLPGHTSLHCEFIWILCVFNNSLLAWRRIYDRSPNNNLSVKTKCEKVWRKGALFCSLIGHRKSPLFV